MAIVTPSSFIQGVARYALVAALAAVFALFAALAPGFLSGANLLSVLVNNFALLAIVAVAMTFSFSAGGIDLSVGTAIDFASFAFVSLVLAGQPVALAALGGLVGARWSACSTRCSSPGSAFRLFSQRSARSSSAAARSNC